MDHLSVFGDWITNLPKKNEYVEAGWTQSNISLAGLHLPNWCLVAGFSVVFKHDQRADLQQSKYL